MTAPRAGSTSMLTDHSTDHLLDLWGDGNRSALHALLTRHVPWIERYVRSKLGPNLAPRAEDLVQESLLRVLGYVPRYRVETPYQWRALVAKIALNVIRLEHRGVRLDVAGRPLEQALRTTLLARHEDPSSNDAAHELIEHEQAELFAGALMLLAPIDQAILRLRAEGMTDREIAVQLRFREDQANTVRKRRERAIDKLRHMSADIESGRLRSELERDGRAPTDAPGNAGP